MVYLQRLEGCPVAKLRYYLVGDEIFPLNFWLILQYPAQLSERKMIFNYRLSRVCLTIQNTFRILVARLRIFRGPIRASRENIICYVVAAICLHNQLR